VNKAISIGLSSETISNFGAELGDSEEESQGMGTDTEQLWNRLKVSILESANVKRKKTKKPWITPETLMIAVAFGILIIIIIIIIIHEFHRDASLETKLSVTILEVKRCGFSDFTISVGLFI